MRTTVPALLLLALGCSGHTGGPGDTAGDTPEEDTTVEVADTIEDTPVDDPPGEPECAVDGDCDDGDVCTEDTCNTYIWVCDHDPVDADMDGYDASSVTGVDCGGDDCDDHDESIYPGAPENECDEVDNDCDGDELDGVADDDDDDFLDIACPGGDDCDDLDETIYPGAPTTCDMVDDDCSGSWADESGSDDDSDGYLDADCGGDDCNDTNDTIHPGADEICGDGIDQDCDGVIDGPATMIADARITNAAGSSFRSSLAWTGSEYGIAWEDERDADWEIYFARLSAAGVKVGSDIRITDASGDSVDSQLAWSGSEFGLVWEDDPVTLDPEIYFARLSTDGSKIGADVRVTNDSAGSIYPSLSWTGSEYGIGWYDSRDGDWEIFFTRVSAAGVKVGADVQVTTNTTTSWFPSIVWSGSEFGVSWKDDLSGGWQVYFTRVSSTGTVLGAGSAITETDWAGDEAPLVWAGSVFGLSWDDTRSGDEEVYITLLDPTGGRLGTDEMLSTTIRDENDPAIAWSGSEFGVIWDDYNAGDLYFARVSAAGTKLGPEVRIVATTFGANVNKASITWSGSEFGITWQDDRPGNYEIYFNRIGYCE